MFHLLAFKRYFNSCNKTNKCTYVKSVYNIVFITDMFKSTWRTSPESLTRISGIQTMCQNALVNHWMLSNIQWLTNAF